MRDVRRRTAAAVAALRSRELSSAAPPTQAPSAAAVEAVIRRDADDLVNIRRLLAFTLPPDANCIDIGAHRGAVLAEMVRVAPQGRHIAFEPLPHLCDVIRTSFPTVEVHEAALSDHAGEADFAYVHGHAEGWSGLRFRPLPTGEEPEVEHISVRLEVLDQVLDADYRPDVIKVDVEGAEQQVFEGALETLRRHRPIVVFEHGTGSAEAFGTLPGNIYQLLRENAGLRIYDLDGSGPYTRAEFERVFYAAERVNFVARVWAGEEPPVVSTTVNQPPSPTSSARGGQAASAVSVSRVTKTFRIPHQQAHTLKERALHPFRRRTFDELRAVDDVSLDIATGEFFGIVGRNGSGKSTLLKCLAGIYTIDSGTLAVRGRLSPFIELGVGFNPELNARDNAIINAIMLGLSRKEAEARLNDIVAFAELEEFMELKLKNYSSGMQVRLAFSVAIQVDADIVLIDEVLAVGDASFQQKCFDQFMRLKAAGRTIVFVTHDMGSVERFCDRAMLLERGEVVDIGNPASIARQYNELNFNRVRREAREHGGPDTLRRAPVAEIVSASFESADGETAVAVTQGEPCYVRTEVQFHAGVENPLFAIALDDDLGRRAFAASTALSHGPTGEFRAGEMAVIRTRFENWLAPGRYRLTASVTADGFGANAYDLRNDLSTIIVHAGKSGGGAVDLPHTFEIERPQ